MNFQTHPTAAELTTILNEVLFNETGYKPENVSELEQLTCVAVTGKVNIPLKDTGSLRSIFKAVSLTANVIGDKTHIRVELNFSYTHSEGGSNGYGTSKLFKRDSMYGATILGKEVL